MNRNNFVFSWGRKMFFGLGWPLLSLIALSYLQTGILPKTPLEVFYFLITFIGQYGFITALLYFLLYVPVVRFVSGYYFTRMWSLFVIGLAMIAIFLDSLLFINYRIHINKFVLDLLSQGFGKDLLNLSQSIWVVALICLFSTMIYFWFQGEKVWRGMQRRFSNPNGNWYLILIAICLVLSHILHIYGDAFGNKKITRHASTFPFYFPATAKTFLSGYDLAPNKIEPSEQSARDFKYPTEKMLCSGVENKNIIFITVNDWNVKDLNESKSPLMMHLATHGQMFLDHRSSSPKVQAALFSIFYGLPAIFTRSARIDQVAPVLMDELRHRGYEMGLFSEYSLLDFDLHKTVFLQSEVARKGSSNINADWQKWIDSHIQKNSTKPFFGFLGLSSSKNLDQKIGQFVDRLAAKDLISKTILIITGTNSSSRVPLLVIWPNRQAQDLKVASSHYDLVPTLMTEEFQCTNAFENYTYGQPLSQLGPKDWYLLSSENKFQIIDYQNRQIITADAYQGCFATDFENHSIPLKKARVDLVLAVLKEQQKYRKKIKTKI